MQRERENDGNPDAGWLDDREIDSRVDNLRGSQERTECEMQRWDQRNSRTAVLKKGDSRMHMTDNAIPIVADIYKVGHTVDRREGINAVVETNSD